MSIFTIVPQAVVEPANAEDIVSVLRYCNDNQVSLTPRAGASNTGGSAVGEGIILLPVAPAADRQAGQSVATADIVQTIEQRPGEILVEAYAGLRHDRLQRYLADRGYTLPSDPSSGPLSFIGANVAARASGAHALRHGAIDRYLESLVVILADGTRIDTAVPESIPDHILARLSLIAERLRNDRTARVAIERKQALKTASGYNLSALLGSRDPDLNRLFAGSVGTLGIIESVRLRCPAKVGGESLLVLSFDNEVNACRAVETIRRTDPAACEILNHFCVQLLADQGAEYAYSAAAILVVEYAGSNHDDLARSATSAVTGSRGLEGAYQMTETAEQERFWKLRKAMMLRLRNRNDGRAALSVVNDVGVPVEVLPDFLQAVGPIYRTRNIPLPIYGHAADGNLHLRPLFDLGDADLPTTIRETADATYELVISLGGTITAEHGMGRLRAPYLRQEWGDPLYEIMHEVKKLFDPQLILNTEAMFYEGPLLRHTPWDEARIRA